MNWVSIIAGALKAIPQIADGLKLINENIIKLGDAKTEFQINNIKRDLDEVIAKVKATEDRDKLLDLAKRLNNLRV